MLLRNADIEHSLRQPLPQLHHTGPRAHGSRHRDDTVVLLRYSDECIGEGCGKALSVACRARAWNVRTGRSKAMKAFGVFFSLLKALALFGHHMHDHGPVQLAHMRKGVDQGRDIVPVDGADILESEIDEEILLEKMALTARFTLLISEKRYRPMCGIRSTVASMRVRKDWYLTEADNFDRYLEIEPTEREIDMRLSFKIRMRGRPSWPALLSPSMAIPAVRAPSPTTAMTLPAWPVRILACRRPSDEEMAVDE